MTTPELLEFIRIEHALGMSLEEITRLLISEGEWDRADVAEAFRAMGLPEQAALELSARKNDSEALPSGVNISVKQSLVQEVAREEKKKEDVVRHAPPPTSAPAPKDMVYPAHAAPMHYVEEPEVKPKPTLARPASLSPQTSRSLVRPVHSGVNTSGKGSGGSIGSNHEGPTIHVSRLQHVGGVSPHGPVEPPKIKKSKEAIETKVLYGLDLGEEEPSPHKVATPAPVSSSKVDASVSLEHHDSLLTKSSQEKGAQPHHDEKTEVKATDPEVKKDNPANEHDDRVEKTKEGSNDTIEHFHPSPIETKIEEKLQPLPLAESSPHKSENILPQEVTPNPIDASLQGEVVAQESPLTPAAQSSSKPAEPTIPPVQTPPPVIPPPTPTPAPVPPPAPPVPPPSAPQPPPVQVAPQIIVVPSAMFGNQQFGYPQMQMAGGMAQMQQNPFPQFAQNTQFGGVHTTEMASSAPDIEEQAYLARFGQAPMPSGLSMPNTQPVVTPTIIYAPQIVGSGENSKIESLPEEPKKPDPVRFDIGKLRNTHKIDAANYGQKPSVLSAISGMEPVQTESLEDVFKKEQPAGMIQSEEQVEKSKIVHSLKVPSKRTMTADLIRVGEGVLPEQVVAQATKTDAIEGIALPDTPSLVDEEPIPPPPPKKASKSIFILTIGIVLGVFAIGAVSYYYIALRHPGGSEIYRRAVLQMTKGPYVSYAMQGNMRATSTDAEPEYINAELKATGTIAISTTGFKDAYHSTKVAIDHSGVSLPIHLAFNGQVEVEGNDVLVSQFDATRGTPIETLLKQDEWVRFPYQQIGMIFGFAAESGVQATDYGLVTPTLSLFDLLFNGNYLEPGIEVSQYEEGGKEYYRVPIRINGKGMMATGDAISKYLRGVTAPQTSPQRALVLSNRYKIFGGEMIVDKLMMRPVSMMMYASFDPKLIPLEGVFAAKVEFTYPQEFVKQKVQSKSIEELKIKRADESVSGAIIARDAPAKMAIPTIVLALKQFASKQEYFPLSLQELISAGYLNKDAFPIGVWDKIIYSVSAKKPEDSGKAALPCAPKKDKCGFFHIGTSLEYIRTEELQSDADYVTPLIKGVDSAGCSGEQNKACFDLIGVFPE